MSASSMSARRPRSTHAGGRLLEVLAAPGVDGHVAAGVGQPPRDGPADAPARPCHDRHLPVEAELVEQAHT